MRIIIEESVKSHYEARHFTTFLEQLAISRKEMELEVSKNWSKFKEERRTKCLNLADACLSWGIYDGIRLAWSNRVVGSF